LRKKRTQPQTSSSLLHRVEKVIQQHALCKQQDKIIVGVSGGSDSLALLYLLHALHFKLLLTAVYIDHGLRPEEIKEEEQTIQHYCLRLGIPFISKSIKVREYAAKTKHSIEESARILRHNILEKIRIDQHASLIALAHTADDQVEEFFIRLLRGTSLKGLSGIQFKRDRIIRPLLQESKTSLMNYLIEKNVSFCQDSSNFSRKFLRNRVRLDLLPKLEKEFNPSIRKTMLQNIDILAQEEDFLNDISRTAFKKCVSHNLAIHEDITPTRVILLPDILTTFHHAIQCRVIERCFWLMKIKPGYLQIRSLLHFTQSARNSAEMHLADGVRVTKSDNQIALSRPLQRGQLRGSIPFYILTPQWISGPGCYTIKELGKILRLSISTDPDDDHSNKKILFLDSKKVTFPLLLRSPTPGESFRPYNAPGRKKILRYLGEKKIAIKKRIGYPVLVSDDRVIALPGLQISHDVRVTETTKNKLIIELDEKIC